MHVDFFVLLIFAIKNKYFQNGASAQKNQRRHPGHIKGKKISQKKGPASSKRPQQIRAHQIEKEKRQKFLDERKKKHHQEQDRFAQKHSAQDHKIKSVVKHEKEGKNKLQENDKLNISKPHTEEKRKPVNQVSYEEKNSLNRKKK